MSAALKKMPDTPDNDFELTGDNQPDSNFELEALQPEAEQAAPLQAELFLPESNPEQPEASPQIEFDGMQKLLFSVLLDDGREVHFQHATTLLESLEAQDVAVHYQCREGYCGSCRVQLLEGDVHYAEEPMAWLNEGDILPCCCIPKSNIKIKL